MKVNYTGWSRADLMRKMDEERARHPDLRRGQALYNVAYRENPAIARLAAGDCDPYYDDMKIAAFLERIGAQ